MNSSDGYTYCLIMIDRFSKWPQAISIKNHQAKTVAKAFFTHWISRFSSLKLITTDQESEFESRLFMALTQLVRVVFLGLRTCYKEELKASPAEYLYGTFRIPEEFFTHEDLQNNPNFFLEDFHVHMRAFKSRPTAYHGRKKIFCFKDLHTCTHVFIRQENTRKNTLDNPYSGPHRIIERINDRVFTIDVNGLPTNISIEGLKPAYQSAEENSTVEYINHSSEAGDHNATKQNFESASGSDRDSTKANIFQHTFRQGEWIGL
ncbi:uncharacterized protein LOC105424081 [Pogonomyrmex barbatus]|uniref:Uncharacterized protein LOC105424081 n=1 Tax=Pogonomyrmex barbatus TaxID=144034 RepID=A0A6I9WKY9_9HYME|nr:uncharacterized protein LOC105424081 [Pogonomyrmex barbatus]